MDKKAQYYTFAGLLFMIFVFIIVDSESKIRTVSIEEINYYLDNYVYESKNVINNAVFEDLNVSNELIEYTEEFISYVENKNMDVGILVLYSDDGTIQLLNYLDNTIKIQSTGDEVYPEETSEINYDSEVYIEYDGESYLFEFMYPDKSEIKTLFIKNE